MPETIALGVPPTILDLVQKGLIERFFYDGLFQALLFRADAQQEEFQGNIGETVLSTRAGVPDPITKPIAPGVDPVPRAGAFEQWETTLLRYADATDVNMPTAAVASADIFLRAIQTLGMGSGLSLNRIPRNALFTAYLSGQTTCIDAVGATDLVAHVSSINGFVKVLTKGTTIAPVPVSTTHPLSITIAGISTTVVGATPDDGNVPLGPGTLTLGSALGGGGAAARASVLSVARPTIIRVGGGTSVDAIGLNDVVQLQDIINLTNRMRAANIFPHEDGTYHLHISTGFNGQIFTDPSFQRQLNQGVGIGPYQTAFIGNVAGCSIYLNNETPDDGNSGALVATGTKAKYAEDINAEVVNESGVRIGRSIITGRGAIFERWFDEKRFVSEAGITGKLAQFAVTNQGIAVQTEHVTLIMRSPINRLQDQVGLAWSYSGAFPIPSDITSGGPQLFKRAVCVEFALDAS